jgi:hypothetical protein
MLCKVLDEPEQSLFFTDKDIMRQNHFLVFQSNMILESWGCWALIIVQWRLERLKMPALD